MVGGHLWKEASLETEFSGEKVTKQHTNMRGKGSVWSIFTFFLIGLRVRQSSVFPRFFSSLMELEQVAKPHTGKTSLCLTRLPPLCSTQVCRSKRLCADPSEGLNPNKFFIIEGAFLVSLVTAAQT